MNESIRIVSVDRHRTIEDLEEEIEALSQSAARCRKIRVGAQVLVAAGGLLVLGLVSGLIRFNPLALVLALAAVPAGIALYGSNNSTLLGLQEDIDKRQKRRKELIDTLPFGDVLH